MPIRPKLMSLLQDRYDQLGEDETHLVRISGQGHIQRTFERVCQSAGVEQWERIFQTLRSSCEKEWAIDHPQYAVSKWIGHSITVSGRHYANAVPDELLDKVAKGAEESEGEDAANSDEAVAVEATEKRAAESGARRAAKAGAAVGGGLTQSDAQRSESLGITELKATPRIVVQNDARRSKVEAGGIEPPSRDNADVGLYMLRRCFNLGSSGEHRHPSDDPSRLLLIPAPTSERGNQPAVLSRRVADIRIVPSSLN